MRARKALHRLWLLQGVLCLLLAGYAPAGAQDSDGIRIGLTVGGISTVGIVVEFFRDSRSLDVNVGTWAFSDLSLSVVAKQYIGSRALRPYVGGGFWLVIASPPEQRTGLGLIARVPIGLDWEVVSAHSLGAALSLSRALAVRRPDPEDDLPLNRRLVPLPGMYYRWTS